MHSENVFGVVSSRWVVGRVHRKRFTIMVNRDVDRAPEGAFDASACTTTASKVVDDEFAAKVQRETVQIAFHLFALIG
ncbi:hypothetical protein [Paraburkholderia franconis]|uniref:hypothetical protein n=1 Tax=Paraburkholderia franconis TaxID=2654983 RepID=UPI002AAFC3E8|nr:hypothetical protein [Paraburkholderia franconis]